MSFPAARLGDLTAHGGTVSLGTPLTLIGSMPAARMGDLQTCPMMTPAVVPVPHVGGPIVLGAFNVLVGGPPQARVTDMTVCVGPPGIIAMGHFTTLVGMAGAFSGGVAGLLGLIVGGILAALRNLGGQYPRAVACPVNAQNPAGYYTEYGPGIRIRGTPEFQQTVVQRLRTMETTEAGRTRLARINASGHTMTIVEYAGNNSFCGPADNPGGFTDATRAGGRVYDGNGDPIDNADGTARFGTGRGTDTVVQYNPNLQLPNSLDPGNPMPNDGVLFHEMGHGENMMTGQYDGTPDTHGWTTTEDRNVIRDMDPSEADYLAQRGYPYHRTGHGTTWAPN